MVDSIEQLRQKIKAQGDTVRNLKDSKADAEDIKKQVAELLSLKDQLSIATGTDDASTPGRAAVSSSNNSGNSKSVSLKTPKGTKDYSDKEMSVRTQIFNTIIGVFEKHGAVTIDTPVFELKEILMSKYGEDSKLIYDLKDQGGEECALRYDLTVPFARYLAKNGVSNIKRYHIAKVYRRDQPAMTKGRMREFYQCDFDIAGAYDPMIPDAECVRLAVDALTQLGVGPFVVKVNHRKILDAIFEVSGVPEPKIRSISSAVDKLDKLPWADVRQEMTEEKGLDPLVADRIGEYVQLKGSPSELVEKLKALPELMASKKAQEGIADMVLFFDFARIYNILDYVSFDMSLARGLDYYTGIIYEVVLVEENVRPTKAQPTATKPNEVSTATAAIDESQVRVGSIAAGGRYDNLVGDFSAVNHKKGKENNVPCVGISFGVERIFSIIWNKMQSQTIKPSRTAVFVMSMRDGLLEDRMRIATELWDNGIPAEFAYKNKPRMQNQYNFCDANVIPWAVIIGKDELDQGMVRIKNMAQKVESEKMGVLVKRSDMVAEIKKRLEAPS
ncbi:Cytoplasmic and mitochondrial histidine tRNA synthetase [Coemansia sp. RSA 1200]|nr:Cytoplasmic and mitochondrial histidine tRNA synthetase [Coemansia sp. RSA 1200]